MNALPEKCFSSYDFLEVKCEISSKYCTANIHTESKQSSSMNFKCKNFSPKKTTKTTKQNKQTGENKRKVAFKNL